MLCLHEFLTMQTWTFQRRKMKNNMQSVFRVMKLFRSCILLICKIYMITQYTGTSSTVPPLGNIYIKIILELSDKSRAGEKEFWSRDTFHLIGLLKALSNLALNISREEASTTSLGNLFQCLTTFMVKNFFLIFSLNLPFFTLKPLALVLWTTTPPNPLERQKKKKVG